MVWPGVLEKARERGHNEGKTMVTTVREKYSQSIELGLSQIFQLSSAMSKGVDKWYPTV